MKEKKTFFKRALSGMLSLIISVAMIPLSSITAGAVSDSTISPTSVDFDKYNPEDVTTTLTLNGNNLDYIQMGTTGDVLVSGTDYAFDDVSDILTIKSSFCSKYLSLPTSGVALTIHFSAGNTCTLEIHGEDLSTAAPTVSDTVTVSSITTQNATFSGTVTSTGGSTVTEHGFQFGTSSDLGAVGADCVTRSSLDSSTDFSVTVNVLSPSTTYYVRAFVKNYKGTDYGATTSFNSADIPAPTVSTVTITPDTNVSVTKGLTKNFSAAVTGDNGPSQDVTWSVIGGIPATTISTSGVLTVSSNETASTLTVRATSDADDTKYDEVTVNLIDVHYVAQVTIGSTVTSYTSLPAAFNAVPVNGTATIKLLDDITLTSSINIAPGENITLNLNGFDITASTIDSMFISNGSFTVDDSASGGSIQNTGTMSEFNECIYNQGGILTINGGTIRGNYDAISYAGTFYLNGGTIIGSTYGVDLGSNSSTEFYFNAGTVQGGTYAFALENSMGAVVVEYTDYIVPTGYHAATTDGGKTYTVQLGGGGSTTGNAAQVTIGSVTTDYTTLGAAFSAVPLNGTATIKLLKNVTLTSPINVPVGQTVTLNLNGKNIMSSIVANESIKVYGTLNLTDSSSGTAGSIQNTASPSAAILDEGTVNMSKATIDGAFYGVILENGSTFILNSGTVSGADIAFLLVPGNTLGYTLGADSEYVTNTPTLITVKSNSETVDDSPKHNDDNDSEPVSDGASGWSGIQDNIDDADSGDEIDVNMNGSHTLPSSVLSAIKGKNIDLVIDMGDYTWTINGKDVTTAKDIDLRVLRNRANLISQTLINNLVGTRSYEQVELRYDGEFGFTGTLTINMTKSNAGKYANLYYHNPATGKLEYQTSGKIGTDGKVDLDFSHASDYVLVLDDKAMTDELSAGAPMTDTSTPITAENTLPYIAVCVVLTVGMIVYKQKKQLNK